MYQVSQKKVWCSKFIDILRMGTDSNVIFSVKMHLLSSCVWNSTLYMSNLTKVINLRRMMGQTGLTLSNNKFTQKGILSSKSFLTYHSPCGYNFSYLWHIGLKLYTHPDQSCIYHVSNITLIYCTIRKILLICYTVLFWDTPYM